MRKPLRQRKERIILSEQTGTSSGSTPNHQKHSAKMLLQMYVKKSYPHNTLGRSYCLQDSASTTMFCPAAPSAYSKWPRMKNGRLEWNKAALDGALNENARGQYLGAVLSVIFAVVALIQALLEREPAASAFPVACAAFGIFHFKSWRPE